MTPEFVPGGLAPVPGSSVDATRSPSRLLAFLGLVSLLVLLSPHEADARTWLRRKSGKGLIFARIQDAVDVSADGDTVDIGPGSFNERVSVVDKTLLIRGAGREQTEV